MKKRFRRILVCTFIMLLLVGCSVKYNIDDFIGKTSAEIVSEFGSFDCTTMPADSDGLYRNCRSCRV